VSTDLQSRAEVLFYEALELPPGEREAFVNDACGADVSLRVEVDELLRAHDGAAAFLQVDAPASPELEAEFARLKPEEVGERIGDYNLLGADLHRKDGWRNPWKPRLSSLLCALQTFAVQFPSRRSASSASSAFYFASDKRVIGSRFRQMDPHQDLRFALHGAAFLWLILFSPEIRMLT
jgi:hypothetical protein